MLTIMGDITPPTIIATPATVVIPIAIQATATATRPTAMATRTRRTATILMAAPTTATSTPVNRIASPPRPRPPSGGAFSRLCEVRQQIVRPLAAQHMLEVLTAASVLRQPFLRMSANV